MVHEPELRDRVGGFVGDTGKVNDIEELCHTLIEAANKNGGTDNVTVVAIRVLP